MQRGAFGEYIEYMMGFILLGAAVLIGIGLAVYRREAAPVRLLLTADASPEGRLRCDLSVMPPRTALKAEDWRPVELQVHSLLNSQGVLVLSDEEDEYAVSLEHSDSGVFLEVAPRDSYDEERMARIQEMVSGVAAGTPAILEDQMGSRRYRMLRVPVVPDASRLMSALPSLVYQYCVDSEACPVYLELAVN
jgi:hypothetical protein